VSKAGGRKGPKPAGPNDSRCTPQSLLDVVRQFDTIALDPCSNPSSIVGAKYNLSLENGDDGLDKVWAAYTANKAGIVYVNPPWSDPLPWAKKCRSEYEEFETEIIWLARVESATAWAHTIHESATAVCLWKTRLGFPLAGETKTTNDVQASMVAYFGPRVHQFSKVFSPHGYVYTRDREND